MHLSDAFEALRTPLVAATTPLLLPPYSSAGGFASVWWFADEVLGRHLIALQHGGLICDAKKVSQSGSALSSRERDPSTGRGDHCRETSILHPKMIFCVLPAPNALSGAILFDGSDPKGPGGRR